MNLNGQFFAPENPNVMNAADGFRNYLQTLALQAGVDYTPGLTAADSLQLFMQAVAAREQQANPQDFPARVPQYTNAQPAQTAQFYNPNQPVYTEPQPGVETAKNPFTFWTVALTALLALSGKG